MVLDEITIVFIRLLGEHEEGNSGTAIGGPGGRLDDVSVIR